METKFNFWIPIDDVQIEKSDKGDKDAYENMIISGVASDNSEDADGEVLEPSGFDISDFKKHGLINLEHFPTRKQSPKAWIGEPLDAKIKDNKFHIKAKLWKDSELAREAYDTMITMQNSGSNRKVGWSIEGNATKRDPANDKRILKAKITNCALTFRPKNMNTFADIIKGKQNDDFIEPEFETNIKDGEVFLFQFEKAGEVYRIDKNFEIYKVEECIGGVYTSLFKKEPSKKTKIKKAMSAGLQTGRELNNELTNGASLKKESLDKRLKILVAKLSEKNINKDELKKILKNICNML